jgi:hypothetical protein
LYCGFDALANGVIPMIDMDAQPAKFLFHSHVKLASSFLLQFNDQRFQVFA